MISLSEELLKSPKKQQEHDAYIVFPAEYSNPYGRVRRREKIILHLGRGSILKGSVQAVCNHAVGRLDLNPYTGNWELRTLKEVFEEDPRYKRGLYCKRCIHMVLGVEGGGKN